MYNPYDFYFKKAKKEWFKARSAFKLEEIDERYKIFTKDTKNILDIGCAPGSWMQYAHKRLRDQRVDNFKIIWFDLKDVDLNTHGIYAYKQDITELDKVNEIISSHDIEKFDVIMSDMAPNTIWLKDIDAMRSIWLLEKTLVIYENYLKPDWKFMIKVFMWPRFDEFVKTVKQIFWAKWIKIFKPDACRKESKETYIIKYQ